MLGNSVMANNCWFGMLLGGFVNSIGTLIGASVIRGLLMFGTIEKNSTAGLPVLSAGLTVPGLPVPGLTVPGVGRTGAMEGGDVTGQQPMFAKHLILSG
jgi:hypothetical protein